MFPYKKKIDTIATQLCKIFAHFGPPTLSRPSFHDNNVAVDFLLKYDPIMSIELRRTKKSTRQKTRRIAIRKTIGNAAAALRIVLVTKK